MISHDVAVKASIQIWSAKEAADCMSFLAMAGFKTNEVMAAMPSMLLLASAGAMDLASIADIASNILTGFKKPASEMSHVGDILTNPTVAVLWLAWPCCLCDWPGWILRLL